MLLECFTLIERSSRPLWRRHRNESRGPKLAVEKVLQGSREYGVHMGGFSLIKVFYDPRKSTTQEGRRGSASDILQTAKDYPENEQEKLCK